MATKILIIEDEPEIQAILAISLQRVGGFETVVASDGIEGIERAIRDAPDVILLDVLMPRLDGYATCKRLKADHTLSHIPVVFLTAKTDPQEVERAIRAGAAGCVAKPFDPLKLADQISEITAGGRPH
jgi:two-component system, OmpR family, response regulator